MGCCKQGNSIYTYYTIAGVKLAKLVDFENKSYPSGKYCGVTDINYSVDELEPIYRYFQDASQNYLDGTVVGYSQYLDVITPTPISQVLNAEGVEFMIGGSYNYTAGLTSPSQSPYFAPITCKSNPCIDDVGIGGYYFDLKVNGSSASGYPKYSYKKSPAGESSFPGAGGCVKISPSESFLINWSGVVTSDSGRIKKGDEIEVSVYPDTANTRSYPIFIETLGTKDGFLVPFNDGSNVNVANYPYALCGNYIQFLPGSWGKTVVDSFTWPNIFNSSVNYDLVNLNLVGYKDCFLESDVVVQIPKTSKLPNKVKVNISLNPCSNPKLYPSDKAPFYKQSEYDIASSHVSSLSQSVEIPLIKSLQNAQGNNTVPLGTYTYNLSGQNLNVKTYLIIQVFANVAIDNGTFINQDPSSLNRSYLDSSCLKSAITDHGNNYFYLIYITTTSQFMYPSCINSNSRPAFTDVSCFYPRPNFGFRMLSMGNCSSSIDYGQQTTQTRRIPWLNCLTDGLLQIPVPKKEKDPITGKIIETVTFVNVFYNIDISTEEIFYE